MATAPPIDSERGGLPHRDGIAALWKRLRSRSMARELLLLHQVEKADSIDSTEYSLGRGGPIYRFERRIGLMPEAGLHMGRRIETWALLAWAPLCALAFLDGHLLGEASYFPLALDFGMHARLLVAVPILLLADVLIGDRLGGHAARLIGSPAVDPRDAPAVEVALSSMIRWRDSTTMECGFVLLAYAGSVINLFYGSLHKSWAITGPTPTLAGVWLLAFSLPMFQFLLIRWLWRMALWVVFLNRISRLHFRLTGSHPDRAGGLGWVGEAQSDFFPLVFATSSVLAALWARKLVYSGAELDAFRGPLSLFLGLSFFVLLGPLIVFSPQLARARRASLHHYRALAAAYTRAFEQRWLRVHTDPDLLGTPDLQSLADLANSFAVVERMRRVPVSGESLRKLFLAALIPMSLATLTKVPLVELAKLLRELLLH